MVLRLTWRGARRGAADILCPTSAAAQGPPPDASPPSRPPRRVSVRMRIGGWLVATVATIVWSPWIPVARGTILTVAFTGTPASPQVTISGGGFGVEPNPSNAAFPGYTGYDYGNELYFCDTSSNPNAFCAGQNDGNGSGDTIGLVVSTYTESQITYSLGSTYSQYYYPNNIYRIAPSDQFTVHVGGQTCSGVIDFNSAAPCVQTPPPSPPSCGRQATSTPAGGRSVTVFLPCHGPPGASLTYSIVARPRHGTLGAVDQATGSVTYRPYRNYAGTDQFEYQASDVGGASGPAIATITIPRSLRRLEPTMSWAFGYFRTYSVVDLMTVYSIPRGARVKISCSGRGCPFRAHSACSDVRGADRCDAMSAAHNRNVKLTSLFRGRHLVAGVRLTVAIVERNSIGKVYVFKVRSSRPPGVRIACLAPGSTVPGRNC